MKGVKTILLVAVMLLPIFTLAACAGSTSSSEAAKVVEAYFAALVDKDLNQMINLSCNAWEEQARNEFNSFAAVDLQLQDVKCQTGSQGSDATATTVTCSGKMIASYGAEKLEIDIAEQSYRTVQEAGEWRMCGYDQ